LIHRRQGCDPPVGAAAVVIDPNVMFEEAALQVLLAAGFSPDHKDGRSVRSRVLVNVVFNPTGAAH
jgi:hypothetical protein